MLVDPAPPLTGRRACAAHPDVRACGVRWRSRSPSSRCRAARRTVRTDTSPRAARGRQAKIADGQHLRLRHAGRPGDSSAAAHAPAPRAIAAWLLACCALVFAMVVVGGVTRLTHSGLSITEWQPIVGTLPPLDRRDWQEAFAKYQATPEYRQVNHAMTLAEFKGIFWWEYVHRLLGAADRRRVPRCRSLWFARAAPIPRGYAWPSSSASSCSAGCRARWAGTW